MMSKFNQNAIINGFIDYFCLVCETYFGTEEDAEQHIEKKVHKKNLESSTYMEKYKGDHVRKVKAGYFCEYCNIVISTGTKVNLHIEEKTHQDNKGIALLKYVEDHVVAFNDVLIKEEAWHGFSGDTCAICNCDIDDFAEHKVDHGHILKLVQGKIQFCTNNSLYRIVDESAFHCLTCNKILAMSIFEKHFNGSEHQQIYASCIMKDGHNNLLKKKDHSLNTAENKQSLSVNPTPIEMAESLDDTTNPNTLDAVAELEQNDININFVSERVFCKKCHVNVTFDYNEIKKHIVEHKNKNFVPLASATREEQNYKKTDVKSKTESNSKELDKDLKYFTFYSRTESDESVDLDGASCVVTAENSHTELSNEPDSVMNLEMFADNNKISYTAGNTEAHCTVCDVKLPASLRNMTEHVNGLSHKTKSKPVKKPKCSGAHLPKIPMEEFVKEVIHVDNVRAGDVVINDVYYLTAFGFLMINDDASILRCLICEVTFEEIDISLHLKTLSHDEAVNRMPIVLRDDDEFVREIHPGIYHCGYCHMVVGDWSNFEEHMDCENHKQKKRTMKYRLNSNRSLIMEQRRQHQLRVVVNMMANRLNFPWHWM